MKSVFIVFGAIIHIFNGQVVCATDLSEIEFNQPVDYNTACGEPFDDELPWLVNINEQTQNGESTTNNFLCYGNIIDKFTVLVPAQCITMYDGRTVEARQLSIDVDIRTFTGHPTNRPSYTCRDVVVHPNYTFVRLDVGDSHFNDIAILKLADPIEFSSYIHPICLTNDMTKFKTEQSGLVPTLTYLNNDQNKNVPNTADLPIMDNDNECAPYELRGTRICAGKKAENYNLCFSHGVSLMLVEETRIKFVWYLRGMLTGGLLTAKNLRFTCAPGSLLFTDVFKFYTWINGNK